MFSRLEAGLECKLTIVSAPAGFGKTTLLAAWFERLGQAGGGGETGWGIAWLSLDRNDNDPLRFWTYVVAALQTVEPSLAEIVPPALLSPSPPPLSAVTAALVNA